MHLTALDSFLSFKKTYLSKFGNDKIKIVEIGSMAVNSSIKNTLDSNMEYIGADIQKGKNVDVVLENPYKFPFQDNPDSSLALQKWGHYNNFDPQVLEHYTNFEKGRDFWNDYVAITLKSKKFINKFPDRILDKKKNFTNGRKNNLNEIINFQEFPQDQNNWGWRLYYKLRKFLHKFS